MASKEKGKVQQAVDRVRPWLMGVGTGLVGVAIGFLLKPPTTGVTMIVLLVGLLLMSAAIISGRKR